MSWDVVLRSAIGLLIGDDCFSWQPISAGEVELSAFSISHANGLPAVFMPANDDGFGVIVCRQAKLAFVGAPLGFQLRQRWTQQGLFIPSR